MASFLPSTLRPVVLQIGVSISTDSVGRSRVISYAISIEISLKRSRKSFAPVSLHRISVSLCAIIG